MYRKLHLLIYTLFLAVAVFGKNPLFFGADPSARVWKDGKMWIYPTTDKANWDEQFDWHAWSSDDLVNWIDHGVIFDLRDSGWATGHAWAPDILYKDGKYYFYYYAQQGKPGGGVGIAISDKPEGPFKEALGRMFIGGHDPGLFMDDDGQAYLYLQDTVSLLGDDMISIKKEKIKLELKNYELQKKHEAVYVFKREGIYYYTIADGFNHLIYFTGDSPLGPFTYGGEMMEKYGGNNHHSVVEYGGKWILWYHGWVPDHHRRIRGEYLQFRDDGSIIPAKITEEGVGSLKNATATMAEKPAEISGSRQIRNLEYGQLLRPRNASGAEGTPIVLYSAQPWKCLSWRLEPGSDTSYQLMNYFTGKTIQPERIDRQSPVLQTSATKDDKRQYWQFVKIGDGIYKIVSAGTDFVLTAEKGDGYEVRVQLAPWDGSDRQKWQLLELPELTM